MEIDEMLQRIKTFAERIEADPDHPDASYLATCVRFMFAYMVRNEHEDAPLTGPDVDEYESPDFKANRQQVTGAIQSLIDEGIVK
jgi:hypothetical protein